MLWPDKDLELQEVVFPTLAMLELVLNCGRNSMRKLGLHKEYELLAISERMRLID